MGHIVQNKAKLLGRVRRLRGQIEAVERALDSDSACAEVLHLLAASRGALNGLMAEVLEGHILEHVASPELSNDERTAGASELVEVIRTYLK